MARLVCGTFDELQSATAKELGGKCLPEEGILLGSPIISISVLGVTVLRRNVFHRAPSAWTDGCKSGLALVSGGSMRHLV